MDKRAMNQHLEKRLKEQGHLIGVAAGSGMTAKYAEKGGADFILALSSGRYRQMGVSSLAGFMPFANSNELVMEFGAKEIIPIVRHIPVVFGLCATDVTIDMEQYVEQIRMQGFSGINNYPTVGMMDGQYREALEEAGLSFDAEVEAIRLASNKQMFTVAFVFSAEQAKKMLHAGADVICAHLGFTKGGALGAKKVLSIKEGALLAREVFAACEEETTERKPFYMVYGGPISTPIDVKSMYNLTGAHGYIGGSSFERIPLENTIAKTAFDFKRAGDKKQDSDLNHQIEELRQHYDYVSFVKEYVAEHYHEELSFSEIARLAHVSRTYLSALFKKEVGYPFTTYLTETRLNKAKECIQLGHVKLVDVASMVGYNDYVHFSKMFKRQFGMSPREYQRDIEAKK
ncbi:phosphoenolpyruvate hydrolase family protein [Paenibacillus sp. 1001270B_150601_E10]|uniref:phosphoenolpyruvate hydrolase family protein n=1 Tax=Paenibacillus sp. 1001270B_150601_E10 TaxID=2787079 RepID=UPI00189EA5C0|nr:phosphoenolpyruvate hydrolase family protein [Paenibacillus sp. 1001270B_150601_E10]